MNEIEQLKAENEIILSEQENKQLIESLGIANKYFNKYYMTLQEIREIAEKVMLTELCNSCDGCGLIYGCNDIACAYYQMEKILQIINKAEEE